MKKTIKQVLDGMLARREYSALQVKQKLSSLGFLEDSIDNIIEVYTERGYLSNQRYQAERVLSLMNRGYGPFYAKQKLRQEGVEIHSEDFCWKNAYQIALRKAGEKKGLALKQYLYRRGFNDDSINALHSTTTRVT